MTIRLAVNLAFRPGTADPADVALAQEAERLGCSVAWAAEAYGSDAATVLAHVAARTTRIDVGSAVFQIPARSPALTAMTAATLDALSAGRFRLGLGVSGPQVSEGWHGVRFDAPVARTREYVSIVRAALRRETVRFEGEHWKLPLPDGPGKALRLSFQPLREDVRLYLAALGPRNLELCGEVADGWLAVFLAPEHAAESLASVAVGRGRAGVGLDGFDVVASVPVAVGGDLEECADAVRPYTALYVGGMGSREQNFYARRVAAMGFESAVEEIQELYLGRRHRDAAAAVPFTLVDRTALLGTEERIAERLHAYAAAGVTTLAVSTLAATAVERIATLRTVAEALDASGLGS